MSEKRIETKKLTFLGLMVGYSLILYIIEGFIPNPMVAVFPGAKLGLSIQFNLIYNRRIYSKSNGCGVSWCKART